MIGDVQFLPGYSVLLTDDPAAERLDPAFRRVNLEVLGNTDGFLHAHVWPRFEWEPADLVGRPVWLRPCDSWTDEWFALGPQHDVLRQAIGGELDRLSR